MPKTIRDLMKLTGRSYPTVVAAIESGQAPGYKVGAHYTVPDEAFELFAKGYWEPVSARITKVHPQYPLPSDDIDNVYSRPSDRVTHTP